jgi:hypothetical protein
LIVLLRQHYQDSLFFNFGILVVALLAMVPVAFAPRWLPLWPTLILRVLGLLPLFVFLATGLRLMG